MSWKKIGKLIAHIHPAYWTIILAIVVVVIATLSYRQAQAQQQRIDALALAVNTLSTSLASTTELLQASIDDTHSALSQALEDEQARVAAVKEQLGGVQSQVGTLSGTVTTLDKLTKTDKELLAKYSKVFFLSDNYAPERLSDVPEAYKYYEDRTLQVIPQTLPYLTAMLNAAKQSGVELYVYSAYRSFDTQEALKGQYTVTYGAGTANQFSADQGYSEHQLGTTIDLITTGLNGQLTDAFGDTAAYRWLDENAYRFGFILSYPKGNKFYIYEPWHWRFVGVKLATDLHNQGKHFYDLDQREIDTYLVSIFDSQTKSKPHT